MFFTDTKVFVSHASEDQEFARDLAARLSKSVEVWFDEYSIKPGGGIFQSINSGLSSCDFGVVIFSKEFLAKRWTIAELAGLFALEDIGARIVPIWHDISYAEVCTTCPIMVDRRAINTSEGINAVVEFVLLAIRSAGLTDAFIHTGTVDNRFCELGEMIKTSTEKESLFRSEQGAERVFCSQTEFFAIAPKRISKIALNNPQLELLSEGSEFKCIPNDKIYLNINAASNLMLRFEGTRPSRISIDIARIEVYILKKVIDDCGVYIRGDRIESHVFTPSFDSAFNVVWQQSGAQVMSIIEVIDFGLGLLHGHLAKWVQGRYGD